MNTKIIEFVEGLKDEAMFLGRFRNLYNTFFANDQLSVDTVNELTNLGILKAPNEYIPGMKFVYVTKIELLTYFKRKIEVKPEVVANVEKSKKKKK